DIYMPEMDGRDLVRMVRNNDGSMKKLPVIIMSSAVGSEGVTELLETGTTYFLAKPLNAKIMKETVMRCFNQYSEHG
ncbi:MAG: response regulator, partial [Planctomycetota bacterium]